MRFLVGLFLSAFLAGICHNSYAQLTSSAIQGKVLTEERAPAAAATVILLTYRDSSIVSSAVTDKNGLFQFEGLQRGRYLLLVTIVGYEKLYSGPFDVLQGQTFVTPDIILHISSKQLGQVSVFGTRPEIETRPGKMILNIQNSIIAAGSSVYDILRQSPGVRIDNSNNISIIGRQNALITIDGRPTNLTGEDLIEVLRAMQSNTIDRIELITSGSAKYDAAGAGIINIISKKGTGVGANGSVTATEGYGKYSKSAAGVVFNDRSDKVNIFGSYNYSYNKSFRNIVTDRTINFDNVMSNYNTNYNNTQVAKSNTFTVGTDYAFSSRHTIGFLVNGTFTSDNFKKNTDLKIYNQSILDSTITANSYLDRQITRLNYNLNYNGKLDESGTTLSADVNYSTNKRSSAEYITNDFYNAAENIYRNPQLLQNLSPSDIRIWLSRIDFSDPLSKTSKLEAGLEYRYVTSDNELVFGPLVNGVYTSDPRFSNHFIYTENINAGYVNYENSFDKFQLTAALRAEQTIAKGNSVTSMEVVNSNYLDLFPNVMLIYKYNNENEFSLSYNRRITRPLYEDLNPFLYYTDPYDYRAGNPYLKPQYSNTVELSYNYNKTLVTTLYSSIVNNADDFNVFEQNDTTKVNITTKKNLGNIYNYGIRFFAPVVFTNWWSGNFLADASYQRYIVYPRNGNLNKGTQDVIFSSTQHFILSNSLTAEVSGKYESPTFYGVSGYKAQFHVDAAVSQQLFEKRGSLKLSAFDIFNTLRDRLYTNYHDLNMSIVDKKESQMVRLTFTYRFGKTSVKAAAGHTTLNKDEQKRIGVGSEN